MDRVEKFYNKFPYPHYPLLAKPILEDSYLSQCGKYHNFSNTLSTNNANILVIGCGEIQPYIFQQWNPQNNYKIYCVDVSKKSLNRARFRLGLNFKNIKLIHSSIEEFLLNPEWQNTQFDLIECYGVLHHLKSPEKVIPLIAKSLPISGTLRVMVYNSYARGWIIELQKLFQYLELSALQDKNISKAKSILQEISTFSPYIKQNLSGMGDHILKNNSRFADTFLNERELSISYTHWNTMFQNAELIPFSLLDRYCELDDLENPFWKMPSVESLSERISDYRFENNFEILLKKCNDFIFSETDEANKSGSLFHKNNPPRIWTDYKETKNISKSWLKDLWFDFLDLQTTSKNRRTDFSKITLLSSQRLARIGAIPKRILNKDETVEFSLPMEYSMDPPPREKHIDSKDQHKKTTLYAFKKIEILLSKEFYPEKKEAIVNQLKKIIFDLY